MKNTDCGCGCEEKSKPVQYKCDCEDCDCGTVGFDKAPKETPTCCGKPMKRVK
ncbi:MAG: hypothetical protein V1934_03125 [Methanobacteriota archaeon]